MKTEKSSMPIKALAPWFGGKRNLAPRIVQLLGKHRVYWEPFCGSCAVLLAKPPCVMETVCDLHGDLINLARVVQREYAAVELFGKLARTMMSEQLHREAAERYRARGYLQGSIEPDVDRAYDYMLCAWMGRNGVAGIQSYNQGFCRRFTANGGHAAKRWRSVIESIPAWHWRLMNVTILCCDAFEVIPKIEDKKDTAIYIDPPYLKKNSKYIFDFEDADHNRLAEQLRRFEKSKVVVSYNDDERLGELYPGWTSHKIKVTRAMSCTTRRGKNKTKAVEVLLTNFDNKKTGLF